VKRLPALSLLVLVLYNTFGYYLFFAYQSKKEQVAFAKQLDEQSSTFGVIKFNLAIYSSVPETDLEYENRDITIEDKTYRIVRRFVKNDTLNVVYVRNRPQELLRHAFHQILESQFDTAHRREGEQPVKLLFKSISDEYIRHDTDFFTLAGPTVSVLRHILNAPPIKVLYSIDLSAPSPPPEV
jgi:hypothetical protein